MVLETLGAHAVDDDVVVRVEDVLAGIVLQIISWKLGNLINLHNQMTLYRQFSV